MEIDETVLRPGQAGPDQGIHPTLGDRRINVRRASDLPILKKGASCQDLLQLHFRRQGLAKNSLYFRVSLLKSLEQLRHGHELITGHEQDQIRLVGVFQTQQILAAIRGDHRQPV